MRRPLLALASVVLAFAATAADNLTIVKAGPVGEVSALAEASEVRVVFSEPMTAVGKPAGAVPWFRISPAVEGSFRWAGTTTLIFTPKAPLPFATNYEVAIGPEAKALSGKALGKPYSFSFTTPTIQLRAVEWTRLPGAHDAPVVVALRFNQPVEAQTIVRHLQLRTAAQEIRTPLPPNPERLTEAERAAFQAKKARAEASAASDGQPVLAFVAESWDTKRFPPAADLVVLQTRPGVAPGTQMKILLDSELARTPRNARTGRAQEFVVQLAPPFFVERISCLTRCDPDAAVHVELTAPVRASAMAKAISITDVTDPARPQPLERKRTDREYDLDTTVHSLDEFGYFLQPARTYLVRIEPGLTAATGETLGYAWTAVVENWHRAAFTSFGDGNGVWEASGGTVLPFYARNFRNIRQWVVPLTMESLVPTLVRLEANNYQQTPPGAGQLRALTPSPDKTQSYGVDVRAALNPSGKGLLWAAVKNGEPIERARTFEGQPDTRSTVVQVTDLGVTVKDSPQNTIVFVTRLADALPVAGAKVSIRTSDNRVFWSGTTDAAGIATAPRTDLRRSKQKKQVQEGEEEWENNWEALSRLHFVVIAEVGDDVAYTASNWHDGISPWDFGGNFDLTEADPLFRGTIFTDRGVYKPGEEVHAKLIARKDAPAGMQLFPAGTRVDVTLTDSHDKEIDRRSLTLGEWSSAEWTFTVPSSAPLGRYALRARSPEGRYAIQGDFLVAAYRRPEFRVDVSMTAAAPNAGTPIEARIAARYLFGAPMTGLPVRWTYSRSPLFDPPPAVADRFADRYAFLGSEQRPETVKVASKEQKLDARGDLALVLETRRDAGSPFEYRLEGEVTDVSRQKIAGRKSIRVEPAPWTIGVRRPPYFVEAAKGLETDIIAAAHDGALVPGVDVRIDLKQIQWNSVRRAEGGGFYTWETERKEIAAGNWTVTSASAPLPLRVPLSSGGQYELVATARDAEGRRTSTRMWFYAMGTGYTAWERFDHNRIELVPEKTTWKPGDEARIMIKSPWERATALVTTERESVRTTRQLVLTSTQQTIGIPVTESDIPNVYVSVVLLKGRSEAPTPEDASDPGKPAFRIGYLELQVQDLSRRLQVDVKANRDEFRPATKARIDVHVRDAKGAPARSEVTLWAVDYGVLSLTDYRLPDLIDDVYLQKALQVVTTESRQKIISRRVVTPKGAGEGGAGGRDAGPGVMRKDFRVLAFWIGSLTTDAKGRARAEVTLPESLTTYRIMAVAADRSSRFGGGRSEIRINKPLLLTPAFPRFLTAGDKALFGGVVHSQLKQGGNATVTIRSLDPAVLEFRSPSATVKIGPSGSAEVRFDAVAKSVGTARVQMSVAMNRETDAFEDVIPVRILASPETAAAFGSVRDATARESVTVPPDVIPAFGGLRVELASTQLVGLAEGARYLVEYPYGCAEQRASATLALLFAAGLGEAFRLPGIDPAEAKRRAQAGVTELARFQCGEGGFAFWPGHCSSQSPYLTSWIVHVLQQAQKLGITVDQRTLAMAYEYLERQLAAKRPSNDGWWPAYTAWQAFTVRTLVSGGRNADSHLTRLVSHADRMPLFAIAFLTDALVAKGEKGPRLDDLRRRLTNGIVPEGATAHVQELSDPHLLWFWNSNVRSTAIVLGTLTRGGGEEALVHPMVRWLMQVRKGGRWGNTQENAWAMQALVEYARRFEVETPDFQAVVAVASQTLMTEQFRGRDTAAKAKDVPMAELLRMHPPGSERALAFEKRGDGTLFYSVRLRMARDLANLAAADHGFALERRYQVEGAKGSATEFKAGDLIRVTLRVRNTKERRFVAITDPIPAGTEPVEAWFATTASDLAESQARADRGGDDWTSWFRSGGFDHVERRDDRVNLFATRLGEGTHEFTYLLRATTSGTFITPPLHAEQMYEPEVFGRTATTVVEVK